MTWSTYTGAAGGVVGAGAGALVNGRRGALIGMGLGELGGSLTGATAWGYQNAVFNDPNSWAGKAAIRMGLFEGAGAVAGGGVGYVVGGWDGLLAGANYGRMAAGLAMQASPTLRSWLLQACFAGDTPLLTPAGHRRIDQFRVGDVLWSRSESEPNGPLEIKAVEEVFVRTGRIMNLHVGGQVIRTTAEHPFFAKGKGWLPGGALKLGDLLSSHDGRWVPVEDLLDTGEYETVYNLRVADFHTYFVGNEEWGFSVWAHNTYKESAYGESEFSQFAQAYRKARPNIEPGQNVAVYKYDGELYAAESNPVTRAHAEQVLYERMGNEISGFDPTKISDIYSELEVCTNICQPWLADRGVRPEVIDNHSFGWEYPSGVKSHRDALLEWMMKIHLR